MADYGGSYLGDTWIPNAPPTENPLLTDPKNAAAIAALTEKYGPIGTLGKKHIGDSQYVDEWTGRSLQNSGYGLYSGGEDGNVIWNGADWVPVPEASGSLFGDFITPIALFASLAAGGGALANMLGGAGAGAAGAGAGLAEGFGGAGILGDAATWGLGEAAAGAGALGAAEGLANTGYIDALGGMTDITGTALPGWSAGEAAAGAGALGGFGPSGDLTLEQFLTSPDAVTGLEGFGGSQGIPAMDTLGSTSWLESAANSLANGDTTWLTQNVTPSQVKSVLSKLTGTGTTIPRTSTRTGASAAGALGGLLPYPVDSGPSGIESVLAANADARKSADAFAQAMAQSGKGA